MVRHLKATDITIVMDDDMYECLYVDGKRWTHDQGDISMYVADVAEAAGDRAIRLSHETVEFAHDKFPDKLEDALKPPDSLF